MANSPDGSTNRSTQGLVVTGVPRADPADAATLGDYGVATAHEALGRVGYLGPELRPVWPGARIGGTAVTVLCWPGDNLMIHIAVEQCQPGDVLVVTTNSPSSDGLFGELFATSLAQRGVRGAVLGCGVRDVADLRAMPFPVWSRAISAQGTVKASAGAVNIPIVLGGQVIHPGDVVVADDDGVLVVPRGDVARGIAAAQARVDKEVATRTAFQAGELGLDRYGLRDRLDEFGVHYLTHDEYQDGAAQ
jgi:4-hydroxy-4-methyl-2-oxoglutarate aldolase